MNRPSTFAERQSAAYADDLAAWCDSQVALLRSRAWDALDLENLIEEVRSLGDEQIHAVESHLGRLLEHLLKLDASTDIDPRRGWRLTVREQRRQLLKRLKRNPSLRRLLPSILEEEWPAAVELAKAGLRADEEALVEAVGRYALEQLLDESYFGEREATA